MLEFAEDMQEVCPDALFLNYTNPMSILTHVMNTIGGIRTIGLCHSVQNCVPRLLNTLGMSNKNVSWKIAGINHMAWLLEVTQGGQDLYPEIKRRAEEKQAEQHLDRIRYEIMQRFGYFVTESSHHSAEYYPYFLKRSYPEFVEKYKVPLDKSLRNQEARAIMRRRRNRDLMKTNQMEHSRSNEYCSRIIEAIETNVPFKFAGNVLNTGLITNLPSEGCVEVACIADAAGIAPTYVGDLPPVCAALNRSHMNNQLLTIEAIKSRKKESVYQAAFLDPHASAELSLDDIVSVCDELFEAHGNVLPKFI
jgi:alpha-galactosidase